jgi:hypothetical protein
MTDDVFYPVPGRSESFNHRLAGHDAGHALVGRSLGMKIWSVTIVPDRGPNGGYQGRSMRLSPLA